MSRHFESPGKPPAEPKIAISITLDQAVLDYLEQFCGEQKRSRSNAIELMILDYAERHSDGH